MSLVNKLDKGVKKKLRKSWYGKTEWCICYRIDNMIENDVMQIN